MSLPDGMRVSDPTVVARYLQIRTLFHDQLLSRVERLVNERYSLVSTRRILSTLTALVRSGWARSDGEEIWPVVFLTSVDVTVALCVQISAENLANLGTLLNGPQRIRHRLWEDWWGWEKGLQGLHPGFYDLTWAEQEEAIVSWYQDGFEWLARGGLIQRLKPVG